MANLMRYCNLLCYRSSQILTTRTVNPFTRISNIQANCKIAAPIAISFVRLYAKGGGKRSKNIKAKIQLSDEELSEVIDVDSYRSDLQALINKMKSEFVEHLMIRSAAASIENLTVNVDGQDFPLVELAQISKKNPSVIAINLSLNPECLKPAIKAIIESGLGLNPQQDGTMIYLPVPKVTRELRETLAKNAKTLFGKTKESIRDVQNSFTKEAKSKTNVSEDLVYSSQLKIVSIADEHLAEAEKLLKLKQTELLGAS